MPANTGMLQYSSRWRRCGGRQHAPLLLLHCFRSCRGRDSLVSGTCSANESFAGGCRAQITTTGDGEAMKMQNSSKDVCLKCSKERRDSAKASSSRRRRGCSLSSPRLPAPRAGTKSVWPCFCIDCCRLSGDCGFIASHIVEGVFGQPCRLIWASVTTWLCARIRSVSLEGEGWNNQRFGTSFPGGGRV